MSEPSSEAPSAAEFDASLSRGTLPIVGDAPPATAPVDEPVRARDAIICISGLGSAAGSGVDDVALRMATALDNCAEDAGVVFTIATRDVEISKDCKVRSATILRHETTRAEGRPLLDLYEFDYRSRLSRNFADKPPYRQALSIAGTLLLNSTNLFAALGRRSKGLAQKLQILYGAAFFGVILLYLVLLLAAMGGTVVQPGKDAATKAETKVRETGRIEGAGEPSTPSATSPKTTAQPAPAASARGGGAPEERVVPATRAPAPKKPAQPDDILARWWLWLRESVRNGNWLDLAKTGIVTATLAGFVVRFNLRAALSESALALSSVTDYLSTGSHRNEIIGELARLINHLDESPPDGARYRKVHIAAYSFGSVVALDALFQQESAVNPRFKRIDTLVTIGSPFDFIRTFWPDYFTGRQALPGTPTRWINVYSEVDVLGSNFMDEPSWKEKRRHRRAGLGERPKIEAEWATALAQGVETADGQMRRPSDDDNLSFGPRQRGSLSLSEWVKLTGFRVHTMYWDRHSPNAVSCFEAMMTRMYAADTELGVLA